MVPKATSNNWCFVCAYLLALRGPILCLAGGQWRSRKRVVGVWLSCGLSIDARWTLKLRWGRSRILLKTPSDPQGRFSLTRWVFRALGV